MRILRPLGIGIFLLSIMCALLFLVWVFCSTSGMFFYSTKDAKSQLFSVQSIDTMKESRDRARFALQNPTSYAQVIDQEMTLVKNSGATHALSAKTAGQATHGTPETKADITLSPWRV